MASVKKLAASSHLASFDVRKCKDLNGPAKLDGSQCKEGWTLYQTTGPKLKGTDIPADFHYTNWVDQQGALGLGKNMPMANGSNSDAILVLNVDDYIGESTTRELNHARSLGKRIVWWKCPASRAVAGEWFYEGWEGK